MKTRQESEGGFGVVAVLMVVVIVFVLGAAGWFVYRHEHKSAVRTVSTSSTTKSAANSTTTKSTTTKSTTTKSTSDPYAGWKTYTSSIGGLSFEYPSTWSVNSAAMNATTTEVTVFEYNSAATLSNNFGMTFEIAASPSSLTPEGSFSNGTTSQLSNGLLAWQESETAAVAGGIGGVACPLLDLASNNALYAQLSSGYYIEANGTFCLGQNNTSTYAYQEQVSSTEWAAGKMILASIKL